MLKVYLETTIPSYLTARPSRDLIIAARQQMTREWWETQESQSELFISQFVLDEVQGGDSEAVERRLKILSGIQVLDSTQEVSLLAKGLVREGLVPQKSSEDAAHIAIATIHDMDILLTWNCTHLANMVLLRKILGFIRSQGYEPPIICTPDDMMGE